MLFRLSYVRISTPGWSRTSVLRRRRAALCPLSYGRVEPPAGVEPAPRPYNGRVLAVDTTEAVGGGIEPARPFSLQATESAPAARSRGRRPLELRRVLAEAESEWRRPESNPHLPRCKRGAPPVELHPRDGRVMRTGGVEPPQPEASGLQPAELAGAQRPREGAADRIRTGTARFTTSDAAVTPQPPRTGTTGLEPAASRLTSERSAHAELRPRGELRGWDSNPRSRAHEAREDSRSSTARDLQVWPAGVEPAISGSRNRRGGRLPYSQLTEHPRRDSNPQLPG